MTASRVSTSARAIMTSAATQAAEPVMWCAALNRARAGITESRLGAGSPAMSRLDPVSAGLSVPRKFSSNRQLDRLPVPWHAVPGSHDIGDNPWPGAPGDSTVAARRCQRRLDIVGADHWSLTMNGWTLLAINAQLPGSGLEAEARQWSWLEEQLSGLSADFRGG